MNSHPAALQLYTRDYSHIPCIHLISSLFNEDQETDCIVCFVNFFLYNSNVQFLTKFNSSTGDDGKAQPDNFLFRTTGKSGDVEHCVGLFNNRNKDGVKLHDQVMLEWLFFEYYDLKSLT